MSLAGSLAIQTRDLRRSFGDNEAVAGINLDIPAGEIYGFLGPNGAGKSTTMKVLSTLLTPTSGEATVAGLNVETDADEIRLRIGVALQDSSIDGKQTGRELLRLQGKLYGLSSTDVIRRMDDVVGLIDIGAAIDDRVDSYSGGMKRRLDLAMSLIHRPQILFLDEPTTGLDPASRTAVWQEVRRLNREFGMTIFLTTQYLEEADELAHRVGIIADGQIRAEGTPAQLKRSVATDLIVAEIDGDTERAIEALEPIEGVGAIEVHGVEVSMSTSDGAAVVADVAVALNGCGVPIRSLTLRTPTLDDVFLYVTGDHLDGGFDSGANLADHEGSSTPGTG